MLQSDRAQHGALKSVYSREWDSVMSNILIMKGQVIYDLYVYVVSVNYNIFKNVDICLNRFRPVGGKSLVDSQPWLPSCFRAIHQDIIEYCTRYNMPGFHIA